MKANFNTENMTFLVDEGYTINLGSGDTACEEHFHGYVEIVYAFGGKALHFVNGVPYRLGKGDLLVINYGSSHALFPKPYTSYANIMLKPEYFDARLGEERSFYSLLELDDFKSYKDKINRDKLLLHFFSEEQKQIEFLIRLTLTEESKGMPTSLAVKRSALNIILNLIFRKLSEASDGGFAAWEELVGYVKENCCEKLTARMMSERCYLNQEYFSRAFKKYTSRTFTDYLYDSRLEKAEELLTYTNRSVEEIYLECGFANRSSFFRRFAERYGMTPLKYRKQKQ